MTTPLYTLEAFDGPTINDARDTERLTAQLESVLYAMMDGQWHTLKCLSQDLQYPEASISARLRDLRKDRFGGHTILRQHVARGLWQYRMVGK